MDDVQGAERSTFESEPLISISAGSTAPDIKEVLPEGERDERGERGEKGERER